MEFVTIISRLLSMYTVGHKNVPLYFCPFLRQLLTGGESSIVHWQIIQETNKPLGESAREWNGKWAKTPDTIIPTDSNFTDV